MEERSGFYNIIVILSVCLLMFTTGSAYSWPSPVLPKLTSADLSGSPFSRQLTTAEASWIAALISLGSGCGPIMVGFLIDKIGRKKMLLGIALMEIITFLITIVATKVELFYFARFVLGVAGGGAFMISPLYIGEISVSKNRGFNNLMASCFISSGILLCYVIGPYVSVGILSLACLIPAAISFFLIFFFLPESPYHLIAINDIENCEKCLMKLRNKPSCDIQKEMNDIIKNVEEKKFKTGGFRDLFKGSVRSSLILCITLMIVQQMTGINIVITYMQSIFEITNTNIPSDIASMVVGVAQTVVLIITSQLVDRVGRKILLLLSTVGCSISLGLLGLFFYLKECHMNVESIFWLPIFSLVVYIVCLNVGLGPLPYAIMGEMFPSNVKSLASTVCSCTGLFLGYLVLLAYPIQLQFIGASLTYWMYTICCAIGFVYLYFKLPETKGKTLNEIQDLLRNEKK